MPLGGMEMMLKSLGINPDEIKASIASFQTLAKEVSERQQKVEAVLIEVNTKLDELLSRGQDVLSKKSMAEHFAEAGARIEIISPEEALEMRKDGRWRQHR